MKADDYDVQCNPILNQRKVADRTVAELIGISKGMLADGVVNEQEAAFLVQWLEENRNRAQCWPYCDIDTRVRKMLTDGVIDEEERQELFELLSKLVGGKLVEENIASFSTELPFTRPTPEIIVPNRSFCFTGKLATGLRSICEEYVLRAGGIIQSSVTKDLHYLVIGLIGSRDWAQSTHGRKIEKALKGNTFIISEENWKNAMFI